MGAPLRDLNTREREVAPVVAHLTAGPGRTEDLDRLAEPTAALVEGDVERAELLGQPPDTDAKHEATGGDVLQRARRPGDRERVAQRQDVDARRQADPLSHRGHRGEADQRVDELGVRPDDRPGVVLPARLRRAGVRGRVAEREHDVLAQPQRVEAGVLRRAGELDELDGREVVDAQPDLHRATPSTAGCRQSRLRQLWAPRRKLRRVVSATR